MQGAVYKRHTGLDTDTETRLYVRLYAAALCRK